jgi:tRNA pseudouridine55 synthase
MKKIRNKINGVLLLNKPLGISSNDAIQKVKYILNAEKVGHTGTLDPLATGLLPVCLGEATKFANFLLDGDKEYIATAKLGIITDTGDAEGKVIATNQVKTSLIAIKEALIKFTGVITQIPPMYSALKHKGKALYEYARDGIIIEREARQITVHAIELLEYNDIDNLVVFKTTVSKGTYIRTLAEDIGNSLGCGASLIALARTKTNKFMLQNSLTIEELGQLSNNNLPILPVDILCNDLPIVNIVDADYAYVKNGNQCLIQNYLNINGMVRIYYQDRFLGVGDLITIDSCSKLSPKRMIKQS